MTSRPQRTERNAHAPTTFDYAIAAARAPGRRVSQSQHDARERLAIGSPCAELSETVEAFAFPGVARAPDNHSRWRMPGIATSETARYVVRLIAFNLAVMIIHLAELRWIWLRIGG